MNQRFIFETKHRLRSLFLLMLMLQGWQQLQAQSSCYPATIRIGYIPNARDADGDNGYTIDGGLMTAGAVPKLTNAANFGAGGTVPTAITFVPLTGTITEASIATANVQAIFIGGIDVPGSGTIYLSAAETNAIKAWSSASGNTVMVCQTTSARWGWTVANNNANPDKPTALGAATTIFNGPFGTITSFSQGGGFQGTLSGGTGDVLASDNANKAVFVKDNVYNDIVVGDVDIFTSLGGISNGNVVTNNNDKVLANAFAYLIQQVGCPPAVTDSDSDGIHDGIDIDDDNDGVLDVVECPAVTNFSNWQLVGNAAVSGSELILTNNTANKKGAVWYKQQIDVTKNFNYKFDAYLGTDDNGADGATFSLQTLSPNTIGGGGGTLGMGGVVPSLFIEFDTYDNGSVAKDLTADDHIALHKGLASGFQLWDNQYAALPNIENGLYYAVEVDYNAASKQLKVYWDNVLKIQTITDIANDFLNGNIYAYIGYTASTGPNNFNTQKFIPKEISNGFTYDTDNDGIVNCLDLDSDGDGCSDAYEAGTTTNTTKDYTHPAPYGANGFTNAKETAAESGVYSGTYTYSNAVNANTGCKTDLSLTVAPLTQTANKGELVTYTYTLANGTALGTDNVAVKIRLPKGVTYVTSTASQGSYDNSTQKWTVGTAAGNTSYTLTVTAKAN